LTQTMYDGDMSTTGIRINMTGNPYLSVKIKRNGVPYDPGNLLTENGQIFYEITQSGRYDICIFSYSKEKQLTLYVDNADADTAYRRYFGEPSMYHGQAYGDTFINYSPESPTGNVRLFDAYSDIPVFQSPLTLQLYDNSDPYILPLYGVMIHMATGVTTPIESSVVTLWDSGEYNVLLYTNVNYYKYAILGDTSIQLSGDVRIYQVRFKVTEDGESTTVNHQLLEGSSFKELSVSTPSDYIPQFYGVARDSADKGQIIVAFSDYRKALQYAQEVAWSECETYTDKDGQTYWLVPNLENPWGAKIYSYSGWQNAYVVNEVAERMVEEHFFDMTQYSSYLTLAQTKEELEEQGILLTDMQVAALQKSVVVWYDASERANGVAKATQVDNTSVIKFIGKQQTAVLSPNQNGVFSEVNEDVKDFYFIKDALGLDSYVLTATDSNGDMYALNYRDGLCTQLNALECASGLICITETNIYGTITDTYYIYYIAESYQPTILTMVADGVEMEVHGNAQQGDVATYTTVVLLDVDNYADPYTYIRIKSTADNTYTWVDYYTVDNVKGLSLDQSGVYEISVVDRFSNSYTYTFHIE